MADYDDEEDGGTGLKKTGNVLPVWGNDKSMNLNSLILTNIQSSPYFKVQLFGLKTYHEVIDEIYYKVAHLEPWEAGSRRVGGLTGMCGGVRGVGAGGIVSSAFCLLYKLFTLKLTRKQLIGMLNHADSPYIRGLGFMYARYTLPPADLWGWFKDYLYDEEEFDVKAGGGCVMYMGDLCRDFLLKLDWFGALFPRIPVPIQKEIVANMKECGPSMKEQMKQKEEEDKLEKEKEEREERERKRAMELEAVRRVDYGARKDVRDSRDREYHRDKTRPNNDRSRDESREVDDYAKELKKFERQQEKDRKEKRSKDVKRRSRSREHHRSISHERSHKRSGSKDRSHDQRSHRSRSKDRSRKKSNKQPKDKSHKRSHSRDRSSRRSRSKERSNRRSRSQEKHRNRSRSMER